MKSKGGILISDNGSKVWQKKLSSKNKSRIKSDNKNKKQEEQSKRGKTKEKWRLAV